MAGITNPQAVRFCNERLRTAADKLSQAYNFAASVTKEWRSHGGTSLVPNSTDAVVDGSAKDGRPPIVGSDVSNMINRLDELVADYEADNSAKLNTILKVAVNTDG
jgi:hypothetical protein